MTDDQFIDYITQGHMLYWDTLGMMRGVDNHKGDICYLTGDVNFIYAAKMNGPDYHAEIQQITGRMRNGEIPPNLTLLPDPASDVAGVLDRFMKTGFFKEDFISLGMAKELDSSMIRPKPPKNLTINRVYELGQLKICGAIFNAAFEYDLFTYGHYLDAFNMPHSYFYLAEYDGLPVCACMSLSGDDLIEIAWVCTLNGYRKKGIAGHIINLAEEDALRDGKSIAVLTAFEKAVNAYKRIGYKGYCKFNTIEFIRP